MNPVNLDRIKNARLIADGKELLFKISDLAFEDEGEHPLIKILFELDDGKFSFVKKYTMGGEHDKSATFKEILLACKITQLRIPPKFLQATLVGRRFYATVSHFQGTMFLKNFRKVE